MSLTQSTFRIPPSRRMDEAMTGFMDPNQWLAMAPITADNFVESIPSSMSIMRMDLYETDTCFRVCCECPGMPKESLTCTVENHMLKVKGTKEMCSSCDGGSYKVRERVFGSCQRSICLPDNIDEAGAKCCNKDGVLVIEFPKKIGKGVCKKLTIE